MEGSLRRIFRSKILLSVEGSSFDVVDGTVLIPSCVRRGFDEEKLVRSSVHFFSQA